MISQDSWPGDPGRKQKCLSRKIPELGTDKSITRTDSVIIKNSNFSVAGTTEVSSPGGLATPVVTPPTTTSPDIATIMTGSNTGSSAVSTSVRGASYPVQHLLSPIAAQQIFLTSSSVIAPVHPVATDNAKCYTSILQAKPFPAAVSGPCGGLVAPGPGASSSVMSQPNTVKTGGIVWGGRHGAVGQVYHLAVNPVERGGRHGAENLIL